MTAHIHTIQIVNYKSFRKASVKLDPFTALVGLNGSGKSNFLDALGFLQDSIIQETVTQAYEKRGGSDAVRHGGFSSRNLELPNTGFRLLIRLDDDTEVDYAFEFDRNQSLCLVTHERCLVLRGDTSRCAKYEVENGKVKSWIPGDRPRLDPMYLALRLLSPTEEFGPVYDFLTSMRFYSIEPGSIRVDKPSGNAGYLKRDGSNAAHVLETIRLGNDLWKHDRIVELIGKVTAGLDSLSALGKGIFGKLEFVEHGPDGKVRLFPASAMSDGTLRVLALLLAAYQPGRHSLVAIEEPEATVHPAAAEIVTEALIDASRDRQVLVTTHSPGILDCKDLKDRHIRAVDFSKGESLVCPPSRTVRDAIRQKLYTAGELLRVDELAPSLAAARRAASKVDLFGPPFLGKAPKK